MKKILFAVTLLTVIVTGCYNDKSDKLYPAPTNVTCDTTTVTYAADVKPIIVANCAVSGGCHDAAGKATSGFDYTVFSDLQGNALDGTLVRDITWATHANQMPKGTGSKLPDCDINKIIRWVNLGALNN